jgi:protein-L-isoaspartate(D-aspartate) O-methyltransferase
MQLRRALVAELERCGAIRSTAVRNAFLRVPRELFVPEKTIEEVYRNEAIPTKFGPQGVPISSSSQPTIMAEMLERLALEPGMHVLEIGAGTGYNAALLTELVGSHGRVDTVDIDRDTAGRARGALRQGGYPAEVSVADGRQGFPERAPYDRIIVTASADAVPHAWFEQLCAGGLVEVPLRLKESVGGQVVASLEKHDGGFRSVSVVGGGFMPLRDADDRALEASPGKPPSMRALSVTDLTGDRPTQLRQLSGASLGRLSARAKRRLLAVSLEEPRRTRLGVRTDAAALTTYLSTTLPVARAVAVAPDWGVGVVARDGTSLAYVTRTAFFAHGGPAAERELQAAVQQWRELGRPGADALRITVTYDGTTPRLRWRYG